MKLGDSEANRRWRPWEAPRTKSRDYSFKRRPLRAVVAVTAVHTQPCGDAGHFSGLLECGHTFERKVWRRKIVQRTHCQFCRRKALHPRKRKAKKRLGPKQQQLKNRVKYLRAQARKGVPERREIEKKLEVLRRLYGD